MPLHTARTLAASIIPLASGIAVAQEPEVHIIDVVTTGLIQLSGDGRVLVGTEDGLPESLTAFRWSVATDLDYLSTCGSAFTSAWPVTEDGSVIAGTDALLFGVLQWTDLECAVVHDTGQALAISADGLVIGGVDSESHAFVSVGGVMSILPHFGATSSLIALSADGSVAVGHAFEGGLQHITRWENEQLQLLGSPGQAWDVSQDGGVVVGSMNSGGAFMWTQDEGLVTLPMNQGYAVTADGTTVIGADTGSLQNRIMIWDAASGARFLKDYLESEHGVTLAGTGIEKLQFPVTVSDDGTKIACRARYADSSTKVFYVDLAPCSIGRGECGTDTDGDGLFDSWETDGIDVDGDGTIDIDLPAMGSDPLHKNLFVEVDMMAGSPNIEEAIFQVTQAFFLRPPNALVQNPDGKDGIDLFVLVDETDLTAETWEVNPFDSLEFDLVKALHFGTPAEQGNEELLAFKRRIFRYCVYIDDTSGTDADQWVGLARGGAGGGGASNDFIVAGGNLSESCPDCSTDRFQEFVASTFMHELGHCLGLQHGGFEEVHYKPNYISTMNYLEQFPFEASVGWRLDYSRGALVPLLEGELHERVGFISGDDYHQGQAIFWGNTPCESDPVLCFTPPPDSVERESLLLINGLWVDFNGDGDFSETPVCVDLNFMGEGFLGGDVASPCDVLMDSADWAILKYALVDEDGSAPVGPPPVELTVAQVLLMDETLPTPCPADVDGNGEVGVSDLLEVLSRWSEVTGHPADVDGDGVVALGDLLEVLAAWGPCD